MQVLVSLKQQRRSQIIADDSALMTRIAKGDRSASRELVQMYSGKVARFAAALLNDSVQGEDIAHDVILRLWRGAGQWQGRGTIMGWLRTAAYRASVDKIRKDHRLLSDPDGDITNLIEDCSPSPEDLARGAEISLEIEAILSRLPYRQRSALILSYQDGLSGAEIAEVLGVSIEAVESLLARGRRTCRSQLAKTYHEISGGMPSRVI